MTCCLYNSIIRISPILIELDHPSRIEIQMEADSAADLREMLDGEPEPSRTGRTDRQPVRAFRERVVGSVSLNSLVIDPEIFRRDARLGHAGAAARLEHEDRFVVLSPSEPSAGRDRRAATHPRKLPNRSRSSYVCNVAARIKGEGFRALQPERAPRLRVEVPLHHFAGPGVEAFARFAHFRLHSVLCRGAHGPED